MLFSPTVKLTRQTDIWTPRFLSPVLIDSFWLRLLLTWTDRMTAKEIDKETSRLRASYFHVDTDRQKDSLITSSCIDTDLGAGVISRSALVDVEAVSLVGAEREPDPTGAEVGAAQVHTDLIAATVIVHTLVVVWNKYKNIINAKKDVKLQKYYFLANSI